MGAPIPEMEPVENASAEALLGSLKTIDPGERRKHASVFNYWLSIRSNRQFPPIRDLDPLEISDAGPWSLLLEMIGGGEDAVVRHFGQAIKGDLQVEKIGDAPNPSLLACIHAKLPLVAACREAFAFEEKFETADGTTRCWVTLLPFSATGAWIDYVYGYVSIDPVPGEKPAQAIEEKPAEAVVEEPVAAEPEPEPEEDREPEVAESPEEEVAPEPFKVPLGRLDGEEDEPASEIEEPAEPEPEPEPEPEIEPEPEAALQPDTAEDDVEPLPYDEADAELEPEAPAHGTRPSFSAKLFESLASVGGFYGKVTQSGPGLPDGAEFVEETAEAAEFAEEPAEAEPVAAGDSPEPAYEVEGPLHSKLTEVRSLAEEAREAQIRSNIALYEGLSAAYDFALDAEDQPEEYLRLVEAQGLKIQLRSPMKPVVKLAFDGMCDEPTIRQLEAVLAWALKQDLPRGTLAERIQAEGGLGPILGGQAKAA